MSTGRHNLAKERTNQDKPEWAHALAGHRHQNPYFIQQNVHQTEHAYPHSGSMEGTTIQFPVESAYGSLSPALDDCAVQGTRHINIGQGAMLSHHDHRFGMVALHASTNHDQMFSADIAERIHHSRSEERTHRETPGPPLSIRTKGSKSSAPRRLCNSIVSPLTVRPVGTKDRHSKVKTAKGLRDRRVRLSAPTAIQFFDVQDRLGYDQPSKAVDWLIKKARAAIEELAPAEKMVVSDENNGDKPVRVTKVSRQRDLTSSFTLVKDEEQGQTAVTGVRAESRAKARERARERAREKVTTTVPLPASCTSVETSTSATTSLTGLTPSQPVTTVNLQLFPEFFLPPTQLRQQFDDMHPPSDLSSMLLSPSATSSAGHFLPFASSFFPTNSTAPSFFIPGDAHPLQFSTPTTFNAITTTPISPRGTLQSIFSNPAASSMQCHLPTPSLVMTGAPVQAHTYGTLACFVKHPGEHDDHAAFRQTSVDVRSSDSHQVSHIPVRIRGAEPGSNVDETRTTPSSMQADYH